VKFGNHISRITRHLWRSEGWSLRMTTISQFYPDSRTSHRMLTLDDHSLEPSSIRYRSQELCHARQEIKYCHFLNNRTRLRFRVRKRIPLGYFLCVENTSRHFKICVLCFCKIRKRVTPREFFFLLDFKRKLPNCLNLRVIYIGSEIFISHPGFKRWRVNKKKLLGG
jgi:hypothetical protein